MDGVVGFAVVTVEHHTATNGAYRRPPPHCRGDVSPGGN